MKRSNLKLLAIASVIAATSAFSTAAMATPSAKKFAHEAAEGDLFEVQTSKLALEKSQNADIKTFAQQMIDDHTKADEGLKAAITSGGVNGPIDSKLTSDDQATLNKLQGLDGDDFDKRYVSAQKSAHKGAVKLFQDYSQNGDNDSLKGFAAQTLPTLQQHQQHINQLSDAMK